MTPVRLEPATLRSRVKHSTTEPLRSHERFEFNLGANSKDTLYDINLCHKTKGVDQSNSRDKTICAQQRLRPTWLPAKDSDQFGWMSRLS